MVIEPKTRGFICTTAHPDGCREAVRRQIDYVKKQPRVENGPKKALIIGASTGYGLASRISAAWGSGAATIGIIFDKPASGNRTASAGWYNTAAFEAFAAEEGLYAKTINGDAFSKEVKEQTIALIKQDLGEVDLVIYSLAAPRRTLPDGTTVSSVLKTVGAEYTNKTIDLKNNSVSEITVSPATEEEITHTIQVMGGEDWMDWMDALRAAGVLAKGAVTVAYSYIGPKVTHAIYADGSIGRAKQHLFASSKKIHEIYPDVNAYVSVNKALVTQASAAIPIVPLYISILYKVMKEKGLHEGCIEQIYRLYHDRLYAAGGVPVDESGYIRIDDYEMRPDVQLTVSELWDKVSGETVNEICDIKGYWDDFYQMFGFGFDNVDYSKDTDPAVWIPSIPNE